MSDSKRQVETANTQKGSEPILPLLLVVIDGWGVAPSSRGNAISEAKTKNWDRFLEQFPNTKLIASGEAVGLNANEVGSSGVGHLTIGAGRVVPLNVAVINRSIATGLFFDNPALNKAAELVKKNRSKLHLMGLIGTGTVHSSVKHLKALIEFCQRKQLENVNLHLFTDGRDSSPKACKAVVEELEEVLRQRKVGKIASIAGRYYAMDRDRRWERTEKAYNAIVKGVSAIKGSELAPGESSEPSRKSAAEVLEKSYAAGVTDEFVAPTVIDQQETNDRGVSDKDAVVFFNFRADRAIQLTKLFLKKKPKLFLVTMTKYHQDIKEAAVAFNQKQVDNTLGEVVAKAGIKQLHIAESEKERMVSYYFDGLREETFKGEERVIVASPDVPTYDLKPEMSLFEMVSTFKKQMSSGKFGFAVMNMANPDMVSHSGKLKAAIKACRAVDKALGELAEYMLSLGGAMVITADHGNAESLVEMPARSFFFTSEEGEVDTDHSNNPVPLVLIAGALRKSGRTVVQGALCDVAPTILELMALPVPEEMKGRNLLRYEKL